MFTERIERQFESMEVSRDKTKMYITEEEIENFDKFTEEEEDMFYEM